MISPSYSDRLVERTVPHAGASLVDPLLAAPREKTHDCCRCCHHQKGERNELANIWCAVVAPRKRGGAGHPHGKRGTHQRKKGRNERPVRE
ncbi:unnamed protein product [Spirodela intermedia]|uniref:Uncharacterized protein n=1 Tax=Spirodela intermedia TaxID=51605 RepID=A0A7I8IIG3_SPIIN|nr:unnamed protein product [Spirodela intermedia]CAA6657663.1 unnamed protein product [Spirodela intermedia]